eukprot:jgi/Picsp_1/2815/NSC_01041-R1_protein
MDAQEGALCQTCFVGTLQLAAGILVCDTCGGTQQDFLEEELEYQGDVVRRSQIQRKPPVVGFEDVEEKQDLPVREGIMAYFEVIQDLLQRQIFQLEQLQLASPFLSEAVQQIWHLYLGISGVLETEFFEKVEHLTKKELRKQAEILEPTLGQMFSKARSIMASHINKFVPLSITLSIIFLASWTLREPIDPFDFSGLASVGKIEYLLLWNSVQEKMQPYMTVFNKSFFFPTGVPSPIKIYVQAQYLAGILGLVCPPLNQGAWIQRYVYRLGYPQGTMSCCLVLNEILSDHKRNIYLRSEWKTPWSVIASGLVPLLNLASQVQKPRPSLSREVEQNIQNMMTHAKLMAHTLHPTHVASLGRSDLRQYLEHLEGQYFDFDTVIEDFWFIRSKISNYISLSGNKEEIKYLVEDVREIDSDLQDDNSPIILRVSSTLDHHFIIILVGLSLLAWSSAESILKV